MKQILVYGLPRGDFRRFYEVLLSDKCRTDNDVELIKKAASVDGYHSFRVAICDLAIPPKFY